MSSNPTFRETTPDVGRVDMNGSNPNLLPRFVAEAQKNVSERSLLWTNDLSQAFRESRRLFLSVVGPGPDSFRQTSQLLTIERHS
jgi:hypothetical protein